MYHGVRVHGHPADHPLSWLYSAALVAAIGVSLAYSYDEVGRSLLTLVLVATGNVASSSLSATRLREAVWDPGILAISSATGVRRGLCVRGTICGALLATHYIITPLVQLLLACGLYIVYRAFAFVIYGLYVFLLWDCPRAFWNWKWTIQLVEGWAAVMISLLVWWEWPEAFARKWRRSGVGPVAWHLGLVIRNSLEDGSFFVGALGPLLVAAKAVHVIASVQEPCWSLDMSATSWLSSCTTTTLLAEQCGFACVGDNCAISSAQLHAQSKLYGYFEADKTSNCTWLHGVDFVRCTSLAAPGFGLDSSTGTCSKHAELLYPNAWVLFPSWLAAMVARTIICI